jgi:hypothetical protein
MIDLRIEQPISLAQAAKLIPPTRQAKPVHVSTVLRWILRGMRGVHLEALRLGGRWVTTQEALARFSEALTAKHSPERHHAATATVQTLGDDRQVATARQRHLAEVDRELSAIGV